MFQIQWKLVLCKSFLMSVFVLSWVNILQALVCLFEI